MPASTYMGNAMLNLFLRGVAVTPPTGVFISLHTADPGLTGVNEVTTAAWPSYARQRAAGAGAVGTGFNAASAKATTNALLLDFGAMNGAAQVTITHFAVWDAVTVGNCLLVGALDASKTYNPSDEAVIHTAGITVQVT